MHWNEKVDFIKKQYSDTEFSVPHNNRKDILRNIESKFISRPSDYYELNAANHSFSNWWGSIKAQHEEILHSNIELLQLFDERINSNHSYWLGVEFSDQVMLYKANKAAAINLMIIGKTWSNTFHLIEVKYNYLISFKIENAAIHIKTLLH